MSPPLVVAFALAGRVDLDLSTDPIGKDGDGRDVFLRDLWPSLQEIRDTMQSALTPEVFRRLYRDFAGQNPKWNEIPSSTGEIYSGTRRAITFTSRRSSRTSRWSREDRRDSRRAAARDFWRFGHDRSHFAGRRDQADLAGGPISGVARNQRGGFQQLRQPARKRSRHDARNVRQRADQEPDGAGNRRRRDKYFGSQPETARQMSIFDAAMKYQADGRSAGHSGRARIRHRVEPRLGGERNALAGREGGGRGELRAHSSFESRRHGRAAVAIRRWHKRADARPRWLGDLRHHRFVRCDSSRGKW